MDLSVPSDGKPVKVGSWPITIKRSDGAAASPGRVRLTVLKESDGKALRGLGVSFVLARLDDVVTPAPVDVLIDYNQWRHLYGANLADRLIVEQTPACAVRAARKAKCKALPPLQVTNDVEQGLLTMRLQALPDRSTLGTPPVAGTAAEPEPSSTPHPEPTTTASGAKPTPTVSANPPPEGARQSSSPAGPDAPKGATPSPSTVEEEQSVDAVPASQLEDELCAGSEFCNDTVEPSSVELAGPAMFSMASTPNGSAGSFTATSMIDSSTWAVGGQSGAFTYSYDVPVPPPLAGAVPDLGLQYSSQSVDGRTSARSPQASTVGMGWEYSPGHITQTFSSCAEQSVNPSMKAYGDLCEIGTTAAKETIFSLTLGGQSGRLFLSSGSAWRLEDDPGWRITRVGAYWTVETLNGTKYYFGLDKNGPTGTKITNSVFKVPVFSTATGQCAAVGAYCMQAWRWNLDAVVDPHGNAQYLYYSKRVNKYQSTAAGDIALSYDRAGVLANIDYGIHNAYPNALSAARVDFVQAGRCVEMANGTGACPALTTVNAQSYPDVPLDAMCTATTCTMKSPTFFETDMLLQVQTMILKGGSYAGVDRWSLEHSFPTTPNQSGDYSLYGAETPSLWLAGITRTGTNDDGGVVADSALPAITFSPIQKPNRVDTTTTDLPMNMPRITEVITETGERIQPTYSSAAVGAACTATVLPLNQRVNTQQCFPVWYAKPGTTAKFGWYFKYVVTNVLHDQPTGVHTSESWNYTYAGNASSTQVLWDYDFDPATTHHAFSQWRGFPKVTTSHGTTGATLNDSWYYTGLNGQPTDVDGTGSRINTITTSDETITDNRDFVGRTIRQNSKTYGSANIDSTLHEYIYVNTTTGKPAGIRRESNTITTIPVTGGTARKTRVFRTFDTAAPTATGLLLSEYTMGELTITGGANVAQHRCTTYDYTENSTDWKLSYLWDRKVHDGDCAAAVIGRTVNYYDGLALGAGPNAGDITTSYAYTATATREVTGATYDLYGRTRTSYVMPVATPETTTTTYSNAAGGAALCTATSCLQPAKITTTSPTPTSDPNATGDVTTATAFDWGRGAARTVEDDNTIGVPSTASDSDVSQRQLYDGLGRLVSVISPIDTATCPTKRYAYSVSRTEPSRITTEQLRDAATCTTDGYLTSYSFYDSAGRSLETHQRSQPGTGPGTIVTWSDYNDRGLPNSGSEPFYVGTVTPGTFTLPDLTLIPTRAITSYDPGERPVTQTVRSAGVDQWSTTTSYSGAAVTTTPPSSNGALPTTTLLDVFGRTTRIDEQQDTAVPPAVNYTTFTYNRLGQLTAVRDPAGYDRTSTYDWLGKPLTGTSPDAGPTTSTYNLAGRLVTSERNGARKLTYAYDTAGRPATLTGQTLPTGTAATVRSWVYGLPGTSNASTLKANNQLGRLATASSFDAGDNQISYAQSYDAKGRPVSKTYTLPSLIGSSDSPMPTSLPTTSQTTLSYDRADQSISATYPALNGLPGETVIAGYDTLGRPDTLSSSGNSYVTGTIWRNDGLLNGRTYSSNGTAPSVFTRTYIWDPTITSRLRDIRTYEDRSGDALRSLQNETFSYDPLGNTTQIYDNIAVGGVNQRQCFGYDGRQRLTRAYTAAAACSTTPAYSAAGNAPYDLTYTYDRALDAIRTVNNGINTSTLSYGGSSGGPHAPIGATNDLAISQTFTLSTGELASQLRGGITSTFTWDTLGQLNGSSKPVQASLYLYDADGQRVIHRTTDTVTPANTTTTLTVGPDETTVTGDPATPTVSTLGEATRQYTLAGTNVAVKVSSGGLAPRLHWLMSDGQNSAQITIDDAGARATGLPAGATTDANHLRQHYTPYGAKRNVTELAGPRDFLGKDRDTDTKLLHVGARYYDSQLAMFISPDPLAGAGGTSSLNPYNYAGNRPTTYSDPSGLMRCSSSDRAEGACAEVGQSSASANQASAARRQAQADRSAAEVAAAREDAVSQVVAGRSAAVLRLHGGRLTEEDARRADAYIALVVFFSQQPLDELPRERLLVEDWRDQIMAADGPLTDVTLSTMGAVFPVGRLGIAKRITGSGINREPHERQLENGITRSYGKFRPASKEGPTVGARYVRETGGPGGPRGWMESYYESGAVRVVHPKGGDFPHYLFDVTGRYLGSW